MPVISLFLKYIDPLEGSIVPQITLYYVVFPAPFGPIKPVIEPCSITSETLSTARMPPNCLLRFFISSIFKTIR